MVVAFVEKPDKLVNFVSGLLAESPYRLKQFLGGIVCGQIERLLRLLRGRRSCAIIGVSLGHGFRLRWLGLEPGRKIAVFPSACFYGSINNGEVNSGSIKKTRAPSYRWSRSGDSHSTS